MTKDSFVIQGLAGKKTLKGEVHINGAKNAVLKAMAAAVLFDDVVMLDNVPDTEDVKKLSGILEKIGAKVVHDGKKLSIDPRGISSTCLDPELSESMRASVVLTGPLLSRFRNVTFPAPGGCVIGTRPIDLFIEGYKKMGADVDFQKDAYVMSGKLVGAEIFFNIQTVGGTETLMMAAVLAEGTTVLKNCAMEPEIVSVAEYLNMCGAEITGAGTPTITIKGRAGKLLSSGGKVYITPPDRIEAGSFLLLGALLAEKMVIKDCNPLHLEVLIHMLKNSGVPIETAPGSITVKAPESFRSFSIRTHEYPGYPTDLQSQAVTFLTQAEGEATVFETIYEGRFKFVQNLLKMGAHITEMNPREILIKGPAKLKASQKDMESFDLRGGFASVMAALLAEGTSTLQNIYYIDRGYENLEGKLTALGADIRRVKA